jgi:lysophospholipase L1-like esterase
MVVEMMKFALVLMVLGCVGLQGAEPVLPGSLRAEFSKVWPQNRAIRLVFHGHSVPAGYHKTPEVRPFESYPHLVMVELKRRYPTAVLNTIVTAVGGENCVAGAARFEKEVLVHRPDVVFIDYALNDRRVPLEQVEASWRLMIRAAKKQGVPVVLLTPTGDQAADLKNPEDPLEVRARLIREIAADEGVLLADVFAAWRGALEKGTPQEKLMSQGNHPNLLGHQLAAEVIWQVFGPAPVP